MHARFEDEAGIHVVKKSVYCSPPSPPSPLLFLVFTSTPGPQFFFSRSLHMTKCDVSFLVTYPAVGSSLDRGLFPAKFPPRSTHTSSRPSGPSILLSFRRLQSFFLILTGNPPALLAPHRYTVSQNPCTQTQRERERGKKEKPIFPVARCDPDMNHLSEAAHTSPPLPTGATTQPRMPFNFLPMEIQLYILSFLDDQILVFLQHVHPYLDRLVSSLMTPLWDGHWMWKPSFRDREVKDPDEHEPGTGCGSGGTAEDDSETDD